MHLLWIETEFMCVFMYSWFEFNLAVFLCQETTFMSTNQKSNVKIDWYEQQIRFSECSCSYHITQMSEANEWIICQSNSVHMSIKSSCQLKLVLCSYVNQIWFLFHSFLIRTCAYVGGRARVIISFLMFCLLTQTKTNIRNKTTSELVVVVCSY